eukprot:3887000-Rhodomonas_salina.1
MASRKASGRPQATRALAPLLPNSTGAAAGPIATVANRYFPYTESVGTTSQYCFFPARSKANRHIPGTRHRDRGGKSLDSAPAHLHNVARAAAGKPRDHRPNCPPSKCQAGRRKLERTKTGV